VQYDLVLVMPIYNEEECIEGVLNSWKDVLGQLGINYLILAINDGSTDGTKTILQNFEQDPNCEVINKTNSGHGPTILMGYRKAVQLAPWVFQCDSDDEIRAEHFSLLWQQREDYDALFGIRSGRVQSWSRLFITKISRMTVKALFGSRVTDVNAPFRLMRTEYLSPIVRQVPDDTFAPNLIISGSLSKSDLRIQNLPVPFEQRRTGTISIVKWKLWKSAARAFWQTIRFKPS